MNDYQTLHALAARMRQDVIIKAFLESINGTFAQRNIPFKKKLIEDLRTHLQRSYPMFFLTLNKHK